MLSFMALKSLNTSIDRFIRSCSLSAWVNDTIARKRHRAKVNFKNFKVFMGVSFSNYFIQNIRPKADIGANLQNAPD
jgi:hypothetical protein